MPWRGRVSATNGQGKNVGIVLRLLWRSVNTECIPGLTDDFSYASNKISRHYGLVMSADLQFFPNITLMMMPLAVLS